MILSVDCSDGRHRLCRRAQFDLGFFVHSPDSHDRPQGNPQKTRNVRFGPLATAVGLRAPVWLPREPAPPYSRGAGGLPSCRIESPNRKLAPRQRSPFIPVHGGKLPGHVGKDGRKLLRPRQDDCRELSVKSCAIKGVDRRRGLNASRLLSLAVSTATLALFRLAAGES
jgi:hypothetical protein